MIASSKLALAKCFHCDKTFKDLDRICTVNSRIFVLRDMDFQNLQETYVFTNGSDVQMNREINFHMNCFEELAGQDYVP